MKKGNLTKAYALLFVIALLISKKSFNQTLSNERINILGTWVAEEGTWTFVFSANKRCYEYFDGKLEAQYFYKITSANSVCGKQAKAKSEDSAISFLQLNDIKTKQQTCYIINGISKNTLSLTGYMLPEASVFNRKKSYKKPFPKK
jgi:hypothetical protein